MGRQNPETGLWWCRGFGRDPHEVPIEHICRHARRPGGLDTICKACLIAYDRSPQGRKRYRKYDRKRRANGAERKGTPRYEALRARMRARDARKAGMPCTNHSRRDVFDRTGGRCHTCRRPLDFEGRWVEDHVVALGTNAGDEPSMPWQVIGCSCLANYLPQCEDCSVRKHDKRMTLDLAIQLWDHRNARP